MRLRTVLALIAAAALAASPAAVAKPRTCHGLPVTIAQSSGTIVGTPKRDVIRLDAPGVVHAGRGDDVICGSRGADAIHSGGGRDIVIAGGGADDIHAGTGIDHVFGEGGGDRIDSGPGRDLVSGGAGADRVARQAGDTLIPGTYGVSIVLPEAVQQQWLEENTVIGLSQWSEGPIPVAAVVEPYLQSVFALQGYGVFTSQAPLPADSPVEYMDAEFAALGSAWDSVGPGLLSEAQAPGQPGAVTLTNQSDGPIVAGLSQMISTYGGAGQVGATQQLMPVVFAGDGTMQAFTTAVVAPGSAVLVYPLPAGPPGFVLPVMPAGWGTDRISAASPTATFTWSTSANRFVSG